MFSGTVCRTYFGCANKFECVDDRYARYKLPNVLHKNGSYRTAPIAIESVFSTSLFFQLGSRTYSFYTRTLYRFAHIFVR